jgi:hypothetical protein
MRMRSLRALLGLLSVLSAAAAWVACSSSSSGGKAAGGSDASADVSSNADTGTTTDAGADTTPAPACTPQPVGTPPTWVPSTDYPMNACTSAALAALMTDCLTTTFDAAKCAADKTTYPACSACVFTPLTAPALGPLVEINDLVALNYGGCLGLAGNAVTSACAPALGLENECAWQSCAACTHPLSEGGVVENDDPAFQACVVAAHADGGPCLADYNAANICFTTPEPPAVAECLGSTTTQADLIALRILLRRSGRRRRGGRVRRVTS